MNTSHGIHRSLSGLRHTASRLLTRSSARVDSRPFGSDLGLDRDFDRVYHDLDVLARHNR